VPPKFILANTLNGAQPCAFRNNGRNPSHLPAPKRHRIALGSPFTRPADTVLHHPTVLCARQRRATSLPHRFCYVHIIAQHAKNVKSRGKFSAAAGKICAHRQRRPKKAGGVAQISATPLFGLIGSEHLREELDGAGALRVVEEGGGGILLHDDAFIHEAEAGADLAGEAHLVGDDDHRHAFVG